MRYRAEANKIIVRTECDLRRILELALGDRSYADVAHIASLADALSEMVDATDERATVRQRQERRDDQDRSTRVKRRATHAASKASK